MGITHELDIFVTNEDLALKNIELFKGNSYGCFINLKVKEEKRFNMIFVLRPDWSEIDSVKPIRMTVNNNHVDVEKVSESIHEVVYSASFLISFNSLVKVFSDDPDKYKNVYPTVTINVPKKKFKVVDQGNTYMFIQYPIDDCDKERFLKDEFKYCDNEYDQYNDCDE
ncbi:67R [Yaba monkey tumor virus]|uniref:Probable host range protein 2 n=1 Tax=Yaba monkey tumor virus (strain VR587) TaxID=928314 RepID=VHR2_YMTV5|nr:putative host range protein [Yaba monkey tumor virus]Q9QBB4.1 RecName: Full=Probable host range protein 2 [Yaba monkey tumor virus strain VR587]AAR07423.1 67R [Yaba monkey tumor virus]